MQRRMFLTALCILCAFLPLRVLAAIAINEVLWAGSDKSTSDEWIELTSTGSGSQVTESLDGWTLTGMNGAGAEVTLYRFGTGTLVNSGAFLVLSRWQEAESRLGVEPDFVAPGLTLANTKLLLRLRDASGLVRDEVDDGVGAPFAGSNPSAPASKASMERIHAGLPGNLQSNWQTATTFLNNDDGAPLFATPGAANGTGPSVDTFPPFEATDIEAEVTDIGTDRSIELSWTPSRSLDLQSQVITIAPPPLAGSGIIRLGATATGYLFTFIDQEIPYTILLQSVDKNSNISEGIEIAIEPIHNSQNPNNNVASSSSSSLSGSSSSSASLSSTSESQSSSFSYQSQVLSSFASSLSFLSSESSSSTSSTALPRVFISELLPDPSGSDENQWIELWNSGQEPVDLAGWSIRNIRTAKTFALSGAILAGEYLVKARADGLFALSHGGGELALQRDGMTVQALLFPALPENVTYGLSDAAAGLQPYCAPTPGTANSNAGWNPTMNIQSGTQEGESSVSINLQTVTPEGISLPVSCRYDFGDGTSAQTCNPPSHTFGTVGEYQVTMEAMSYCGTTVKQELKIRVLQKQSDTIQSPSQSPSVSRTSSSAPELLSTDHLTIWPSGISISAVLPNPSGADSGNEWVELFNGAQAATDLAGLYLRAGTKSFPLEGIIVGAGQAVRIPDSQSRLTLTNSSGSVSLRTAVGEIVSSIQWKDARENVIYGSVSSNIRVEVDLVNVIDGDTIDVFFRKGMQSPVGGTGSARVRFIGIDAPETHHTNPFEIAMGLESKNYLSSLIENKKIELEFDTEKQDSYGRLLAYVYASGVAVQEQILRDGMASVYETYDFTKKQLYLDLQVQAKVGKKGHWGNKDAMVVMSAAGSGEVLQVRETVSMDGIVISEVYPVPAAGEDEWIEIFNTSDAPIPLHGLIIDDAPGAGSKPWSYSGSLTIDAGDWVAIPLTGSKVQLNNDGDTVTISAPNGTIIDQIMYPKIKLGMAYSLTASGEFCITSEPTPHEQNICTQNYSSNATKSKKSSTSKNKKSALKPKVTYKNIVQSTVPATSEEMGLELAASLGRGEQEVSADTGMHLPEFFLLSLLASGGSGYVGAVVAMRRRKNRE